MSERNLARGIEDGYRVGADNIAPDGSPAGGYDNELFADEDYRRGLQIGRTKRISEQLASLHDENVKLEQWLTKPDRHG